MEPPLDGDVLPLDVPQLAQPRPELLVLGLQRTRRQHPHTCDSCWRLRLARERNSPAPRHQREPTYPHALHEPAPRRSCHPRTPVTWSMNASGKVSPSASAALRLTTSSNRLACSIGRSPGLAPFKILSTYAPVRRTRSGN